jgi:hypothetical protein
LSHSDSIKIRSGIIKLAEQKKTHRLKKDKQQKSSHDYARYTTKDTMSNSKNSFRIDDILSSDTSCPTLLQPTAAKKRAFGSLDNSSSFDMPKQKPPATFHHAEQQKELQNALFTLLSQQFNNLEPSAMSQVLLNIFKSTQPQPQPQLIHPTPISANIHESYFNEYYARLMNHNSPEDYLPPPSAKRFKPTLLPRNTNNNRDQFQALFLSKFLSQQPVQSRDR